MPDQTRTLILYADTDLSEGAKGLNLKLVAYRVFDGQIKILGLPGHYPIINQLVAGRLNIVIVRFLDMVALYTYKSGVTISEILPTSELGLRLQHADHEKVWSIEAWELQ